MDVFQDGEEIVISSPGNKTLVLKFVAISLVVPLGMWLLHRTDWLVTLVASPVLTLIEGALEFGPERYVLARDGFHYTGALHPRRGREANFDWEALKQIQARGFWGIDFVYERDPHVGKGLSIGRALTKKECECVVALLNLYAEEARTAS